MTATSRSTASRRPAGAELVVATVRFDELRALVKAEGDIDLSTGPALWAVLDGHLASGRRFLRLDVSGVAFVDATALSGLTRVHQAALERRGTLVLTGVRPRVAKALAMTGLHDVLFIGGSRADDDRLPLPEATRFPAQPVARTPLAAERSSPHERRVESD